MYIFSNTDDAYVYCIYVLHIYADDAYVYCICVLHMCSPEYMLMFLLSCMFDVLVNIFKIVNAYVIITCCLTFFLELVHEKKKRKKGQRQKRKTNWFGLRPRTTPRQLSLALQILSKKQRVAVRRMGFGKILSMVVDGIPAKLGHFVVDSFKPELMAIDLGSVKVEVDCESLHQLLGVPYGGIALTSCEYKNAFEGTVKEWRGLYKKKYVGPSEIVQRIEKNYDDDGIMFKLDFLVLFMSTMVECQKHGKCALDFLRYFSEDAKIEDIDWCSYILTKVAECKVGWVRCDHNSKFTGPLTILTVRVKFYLYVIF